MSGLVNAINYILNLGPTVILPITMLFVGLIFGTGFKKAFRSGITIGIGFVGINLVIGLLTANLGAAAQAMVERFGISLNVIDAGWPAAAAASWAMPISVILIPILLGVNLLMIVFKMTKTLDVDIWNYWHFIAAGATGYIVTGGSVWFAVVCAVIYEVIVLVMADRTQHYAEDFFGLEGISLPTGSTIAFGILGIPIGYLVGKIPGLKNLNADPETIQNRLGIFGEPMMVGLILGSIIGLLGGYGLGEAFQVGIAMAGVMVLMPRMVKLLMEGLIPISESAREFMKKRFPGRDLYIGLDAALAVGHPAVMSTALLLTPVTLLIAVLLPGNRVLPFGDLATITFYVAFIVASRKGNIVQSVITSAIVLAFSLWMATDFAVVHTEMMAGADFTAPGNTTQISSIDMGGNVLNWLILKFSQLYQSIIG